jgi:hypothetical protein
MARITRTDKDDFDMGGLAHAPTFPGTPEFGSYIEGQEARGQREVVNSDRIPTKGNVKELEALGFVLGDVDPRDELFRSVTLPAGWSRAGTGHSMYSDIVDANGRPRVSIFYKAAFYDRDAFFTVNTVGSYVNELLYSDDPMPAPIVDEWTTREALMEAATAIRDRLLASATEADSYYPKGAQRDRERAAKCDALLAVLVKD